MIITVNNRLARALRQQYDQQQAAQGQPIWHSAQILPWSAWLEQHYLALVDQGLVTRVLLQAAQEATLWQRIVQQSDTLWLRPTAAAQLAQQAWRLCCAWQLDTSQLRSYATEESTCYRLWQQAFQQTCMAQGWISQAELPDLLQQHCQALALPKQIKLCGFDDLSPQHIALFDRLRQRGVTVESIPDIDCTAETQAIPVACLADEIRAAATWAQQRISQDPTRRIAIISPQVQQERQTFVHILREVLAPQSLLPGGSESPGFNMALGRPLADYPLVAHLLCALQLVQPQQPVPLSVWSVLLGSPFLGDQTEWQARATLDRRLHEDGLPAVSLARMIRRMRIWSAQRAPAIASDWMTRLTHLQQQVTQWPQTASPTVWAEHIWAIAIGLGWPGNPLNSAEYQQVARFQQVLRELANVALVQPTMPCAEAMETLRQLCTHTLFQAESADHAVHVLGILEAAGLQFDAVWLLGMDNSHWPPIPRPHPLLPARLQRDLDMPHASSARELAFAQRLTQRLRHMAPQVIVSFATQAAGRAQTISPLFADVPTTTLASLALEHAPALYRAAVKLGTLSDLPAPTALPPPQPPSGGSHLFNAQAACPFQAVARFRLGARAWPAIQFAPDARLYGEILHKVLHNVWAELHDSTQLQATAETALRTLIQQQAQQVLQGCAEQRPDVFNPSFIALETQRYVDLVLAWLNLEKQRGMPFRVQHLEERRTVDVAGLPLRVQIDRVDQLQNGAQVVIDYKSGVLQPPDWTATRPTELQIPLYCVQTPQTVAALMGQVHGKEVRFRGMAQCDSIAPDIPALPATESIADWSALLQHWQQVLDELSTEIQAGQAQIMPRDTQACERCGLQTLCRIAE